MANHMYYPIVDITLLETNKLIIAMKDSSTIGYERIATSRASTGMPLGLDILLKKVGTYLELGCTAYKADTSKLASIYDVRATTWYHYYG